jgi:signal peptidase
MTRRKGTGIAALVVIGAACAVAWAVLAPPELGGSTRYVILEGSSMQPTLHAGDLALVRPVEDARRGDVVLYEHPRLDRHVLHRIVRESSGRFVLRGDNNDFLDDVRPTAGQLEGELWFSLPGVGSAIMWARQPLHAALIVFALAFLALGGGAAVSAARRSSRATGSTAGRQASRTGHATSSLLLTAGLAAFAVFAVLAFVSHSRPQTRTETVPDAYAHVGTFAYGANVEPSDVYPEGLVDTGDAVFLHLVPALDVQFAYRLRADDASAVRGEIGLTAVLSDGAGWVREIPLGEPSEFQGEAALAVGSLDLAELEAIVAEMKTLTGSGTSTFALQLAADVTVRGSVADQPLRQAFAPRLPLLLDPVSLRPESSGEAGSRFTVRRSETAVVEVPAELALGGLRLSVVDARRIALLGLVVAALVAAVGGIGARRARSGSEPSRLAALFGDRMITISRPPSVEPARITELQDPESLLRLAEHHDRIVLHWREPRGHVYGVDDAGSVYRFRLEDADGARPAGPDDEADTLVLAPKKLPPRAAAG